MLISLKNLGVEHGSPFTMAPASAALHQSPTRKSWGTREVRAVWEPEHDLTGMEETVSVAKSR